MRQRANFLWHDRSRASRTARAGVAAALVCAGCVSTPRPAAATRASGERPPSSAEQGPSEPRPPSGLVAIVDGSPIEFDTVRTALVERAGAQVLRDAIVDARLAKRLRAAGLEIGTAAVERERTKLLETLSPDPARALELLGAIRAREGLGDERFAALLRRNAGLRALVAPGVSIDEEGLRSAFDMLHGPKRVARVAVLASLADAERLARDLRAGGDFARLATERSLDEGAARGGLLAPVARRDPSYPEALRAAIFNTPLGEPSTPALDAGRFLVAMPLEESPADGTTFEAARTRCVEMLRLSRERLLMDALARELASLEGVTVFDRGFDAR